MCSASLGDIAPSCWNGDVYGVLGWPGQFRHVFSWCCACSDTTLSLKAGHYRVASLTLEWGAQLRLDTTGDGVASSLQDLQILSQGPVVFMDGVACKVPGASDSVSSTRIWLGQAGTDSVWFGNGVQVDAHVWAPFAKVTVGERASVWGQVFARSVTWGYGSAGHFAASLSSPGWSNDNPSSHVALISGSRRFWTNAAQVAVSWSVDGIAQTTLLTESLPLSGGDYWIRRCPSQGGKCDSVLALVDRTPPVVNILSPTDGAVVSDSLLSLVWSADGVQHVESVVLPEGISSIARSATDSAGNSGSAKIKVTYRRSTDTSGIAAPVLLSAGIPSLTQRIAFLYSGSNPVQVGAVADSFSEERLSQIHGAVYGVDSLAIPGVRVEILGHPEFGHAMTRADGRWDLAVNGGGSLVVALSSNGYLPVQRRVAVGWQEIEYAGDVFMTALSARSLVAEVSGTSTTAQTLVGDSVSDSSGTRQAVFNLPSGIQAWIVDSSGDTVSASSLTLRATEYTVGTTGPQAMPGVLPANSAYTVSAR